MPTAAVKSDINGISEVSDSLTKLQKNLADRIAKLEQDKLDLENDPGHPKGLFYKKLAHDQITYKKLNPDQMNHLREMDEVYACLESMKEMAEVVKTHINDFRAQAKKLAKKASQEKARENLERVKEVLRVQVGLKLVCERSDLFNGPTKSKNSPRIDPDMVDKLARVLNSITPPQPTDSDKTIKEIVTPAAEHIHLLIDGRKKFVTKATTYQQVKDLLMGSVNNHCYYVEPPTPQAVVETVEQEQQEQSEEDQDETQKEDEEAVNPSKPDSEVSEPEVLAASPEVPVSTVDPVEDKESSATTDFLVAPTGPPPSNIASSFSTSAVYDSPSAAAALSVAMEQQQQSIPSASLTHSMDQHPAPPPGLPHPSHHANPSVMPQVSSQVHPSYYHHHQQQHHHHLEQHQEQPQQSIKPEEEPSVAHNVSISELITRGAFDFLQDSVIDMTPAAVTPTPPPTNHIHHHHHQQQQQQAGPQIHPPPPPTSEASVYMDPAVVSIGSVNNSSDVNSNMGEQQRYLPQHSTGTPPLATIQPPSFPAASIANVPQQSTHEQYFSQSPGSFSSGGAAAVPAVAAPVAAPPPVVALPTAVDTTPNPPPPIPMPSEHSNTNNWPREVAESWADEPRSSESWGAEDNSTSPTTTSTTSNHRLNNGTDSNSSPSMDVEKSSNNSAGVTGSKWSNSSSDRYHHNHQQHSSHHHNHNSKSWGMQPEPESSMSWGDEMPPSQPENGGSMHWEDSRGDQRMSSRGADDYDRKSNRGPPRHRRMDDEDYESNVFNNEEYDDRNRSGVYRRGGARGGRMNGGGGGGGGFRGRSYNGGYQNGGGRGGGGYGGFRGNRGMNTGGGNYRGGMRGNAPNRNGMPRGNSTANNSAFRSNRSNYNNQRPFYGQQQQQQPPPSQQH